MENLKYSKSRADRGNKMMAPLWGGRFRQSPAPEFSRLNNSFPFDYRLLPYDIEGSRAYAMALERAGILKATEARRIQRALRAVHEKWLTTPQSVLRVLTQYEDVHSFVEAKLVEQVGEVGKKIHTGRSRNDQVALDLRLYLRDQNRQVCKQLRFLLQAVVKNAERYFSTVLPGYTHLQRAQPVLLSHYWLAYFEMFSRDLKRFATAARWANTLPLGSAALAGTGFPIDRDFLVRELEFDAPTRNSLDAVSDRDFAIDFLAASSILMMHMSRMAEDLILYSTSEFDFIELSDAVTSGSSILPQKKNPDALELIRGKTGRVYANLQRLLVTLKALPLAYNKDLQEDKEAIFDTVDTLNSILPAMAAVLRTLKVKTKRMRQAAESGFLNATECADYLVRKGLPFRTAHATVGKLVLFALQKNCSLESLKLGEFQAFSRLFRPDIYEALSLSRSLASKAAQGGTAPAQVKKAILNAKRFLAKIQ